MARHLNGGTDQFGLAFAQAPPTVATISFWMRSTQTDNIPTVLSHWASNSRNGWQFDLNESGNLGKMFWQGWSSTTNRIGLLSSSSVIDGNPHHVLVNYGRGTGNGCQMYIDGNLEASGSSSGSWASGTTGLWIGSGLTYGFWTPYIGDIWDIAHWGLSSVLNAAEIAALANGFSPKLIRPQSLLFYAPLVNDVRDIKAAAAVASLVGTSVVPGTRRFGGAI